MNSIATVRASMYGQPPKSIRTRDIYVPDLHIDTIKVKARDFR
jgi:error-prone DNA polymerase